jgi:hypothetical protein
MMTLGCWAVVGGGRWAGIGEIEVSQCKTSIGPKPEYLLGLKNMIIQKIM